MNALSVPVIAAEQPAIVSPADRNPAVLYLASLASSSRSAQGGALRDLARFFGGVDRPERFDWHRVTYEQATGARSWLAEKYAVNTANRYLSALRGVLKQAFRLGLMSEEAYSRASQVDNIRGSNETAGRALERGELAALFAACDATTTLGARNAAMLGLLYGAGLRRAEVVKLDLADLDEPARRVTVRRGKGRKTRWAYLPSGAAAAMRAWLRIRGREPGPLLLPTHGGRIGVRGLHHRRMCPDAVRLALRGVAKRAAVAACSPHDFRRTFVGDLLDAGEDLSTVQRLAGHSNANTTARYDRRPERRRARAAELLSVPFVDEAGD